MENKFANLLANAALYTVLTIGRLFLFPFNLWVKAAERLVEQKESGSLDIRTVNGFWPVVSFIKRIIFDFILDALTFLIYPLGIVYLLYDFISTCVNVGFGRACAVFIVSIVSLYFIPMFVAFVRDILQLLILPVRKFLDWVKKPSQYLEIKNQ